MNTASRAISGQSAQSSKRPRREYHRVTTGVREEIQRQARQAEPPTAREIEASLEGKDEYADHVPPRQTIQNIARAAAVHDGSDPWRIDQGAGLTAGPVLDVLPEVITRTQGRRTFVTRDEAAWIVRIHRARPEIDARLAYELVRHLMASDKKERATIEAYIAYRPWVPEQRERYEHAIDRGWIKRWIGDTYVVPRPAAVATTTFAPRVGVIKAKGGKR